jgi:hypothetical protein
MKRRLVPIYSVLAIAIVLLAVLVPSCGGGGGTGTIVVQATLCGQTWPGAVNYTLTPTGGAPVSGTAVPTTHSNMTATSWTCAYVAGGPGGAFPNPIQPSQTQVLAADDSITFTLDFELEQDAAIEFLGWSQNGDLLQGPISEIYAIPCNIIDSHFKQWVDGCEGYNVTMNETSWFKITQTAGTPGVVVYVVDDWCALNKTPAPSQKVFQVSTLDGVPKQKGENVTLTPQITTTLDVHTQWKLVKGANYTKLINWFGIWTIAYEPQLHPCVLFELILPSAGMPGDLYQFTIQTGADVAIVGDTDVNPGNNNATSAPAMLTVDLRP